ncbi:MAG: response regulator transcription factor [Pseudomonadota bacterium]
MVANRTDTSPGRPLVYVTDDELSVREALGNLLQSIGLQVELFGNAATMLDAAAADRANCLVLDVRLPGISGLEVQQRLLQLNVAVPVIFMTGHADIPMTVRAMKAGAVDFLTKPFRDQDMLDAVTAAVARDRERRVGLALTAAVRGRFETLTSRERQVMGLVTRGLMNKQVAGELGLSEVTVKAYRGQVMRKMEVPSLAELVRCAELLGLEGGSSRP